MTLTPTRRPVPEDLYGGRMKDCFLLDLEVAAIADTRPQIRTITFTSSDLVGFTWLPGQDLMLDVPGDNEGVRRRYTIRRADAVDGTLDIEVVLHGSGPFASWASSAAVGDHVYGIGPRGVVTIREKASHHLFIADTSAIPFAFAMIEALPQGSAATAVLVTDESPPEPPVSRASVDLISVSTDELADRLRSLELADEAVAYVNGERLLVRDAAKHLSERGMSPDAIITKPYWRRDQANASHGEPSKE
jgi:NADPH-dependent ferric siderophore reductase